MSTNDSDGNQSGGHQCPECGDVFDTEKNMKIHYGHSHEGSIAGVAITCDWCGDTFRRCEAHINKDMNNFCSPECRGAYRSEHYTGADHHHYIADAPNNECEYCGRNFRVPPSEDHIKFCSKDCRYASLSERRMGENAPGWEGGKELAECAHCGSGLEVYPSEAIGRTFCNRDCYESWYSENKTGQDHHNWRGGKSVYDAVKKQLRPAFDSVKDSVRAGECARCGASDCKLDVHHIVPVMAGGTNELWNLMTLCGSCHRESEALVRQYSEFDPVLVE